jgi:tuftelin-interacting protein 11
MNAFAHDSSEDSSDEEDFLNPGAEEEDFGDFNPRKRRRTGRDARESAALGVFGSESEDEGRGKRWKSKTLRGKGMVFAKAGKADDADEDDEDEEKELEEPATEAYPEEKDDEEIVEDVGQTAGLRASFAPSAKSMGLGRGLGWQSPAPTKTSAPSMGTPLGRGFVPSSANTPVLKESLRDEEVKPRAAQPSSFGTPGKAKGGFAAKMMAKMGYVEGQGLGKDGQGRSGVIQVQLRPQGVGLGAVKEKSKQEKEEEKRQARLKGITLEDSEDEAVKARKARKKALGRGTGSGASTPRRLKTKYHTMEEIHQAAPDLQIPDTFKPILDMTGPGRKLLTSSSGLMTPTAASAEQSEEDKENLKIVRRAQNDLGAFVEEWKNLQDQKKWIDMQIEEEQKQVERQQTELEQVKNASLIIHTLAASVEERQWDPVYAQLMGLEKLGKLDSLPQDDLSSVAVAAVLPFLREAAEGWRPLEDPKLNNLAPALHSIRSTLGMKSKATSSTNGHYERSHSKQSPYETMIYTIWLPKVRSAIINDWDVHEPRPLLTLLEQWDGLLPSFISSQVYDQLIVQRLEKAVSSWNPKKRRHGTLPHHWLFPWLQFLADHHHDPKSSHGLVSDVKRKFRVVIDTWDLKDGVIPGLQDWRQVLGLDIHKNMVMNHLLPRMGAYLRANFQVDPQDQEPYLRYLEDIFKWKDFLSPRMLAQVVVSEVFPLWHNILYQWLTSDGVNYEEVGQWFEWWKTVLPGYINSEPAVEAEWQKGLHLINEALDLGAEAKDRLRAPVAEPVGNESNTTNKPKPAAAATPARKPTVQAEITLKDVLEDWCMRHDLLFINERKAHQVTGMPLSRITAATNGKGGVLIYIQGDLVFAQKKKDIWGPVDLETEELVDMAHRR